MKTCTLCKTEKGIDRFTSQPSSKDGKHSWCLDCCARKRRERRRKNPEKAREYERSSYASNPHSGRARSAKYRAKNTDLIAAYNTAWRKANPEIMKECKRSWRQSNPGKVKASNAARRAALLNATPKWQTEADRDEIAYIYEKASRLQEQTGLAYHVDHEIPLKGKRVCGLHVPSNLRIIPAEDNLRKSNKF